MIIPTSQNDYAAGFADGYRQGKKDAERKEGKWEIYDYGYDGEDEYPIIRCSECEYFPPEDMGTYNFCPNCGADMRGNDGKTESD